MSTVYPILQQVVIMETVKIFYENGFYRSGDASSFKMAILGQFLARDVGEENGQFAIEVGDQ